MLIFHPFPALLAERSAAAAADSNRKRTRPGDHVLEGVACYRTSDGTLRMAHDLYDPRCSGGDEPGLGRVTCRLVHYPNDTHGYETSVTDFVPASEILADTGPWGDPTAGVTRDGEIVLAGRRADIEDEIPAMKPLRVQRAGMSEDAAPEVAVLFSPPHQNDTLYIGSMVEVEKALLDRLNFPSSAILGEIWKQASLRGVLRVVDDIRIVKAPAPAGIEP